MRVPILLACATVVAGCGGGSGSGLPPGARPIGPGKRFQPPLRAVPEPGPDCRRGLGPRVGVHLELFAERFVVLFPAGIGTRPPRRLLGGRIEHARCYGPLVTIDPTGLVLLRPGTQATVGDVFAAWGQPLSSRGGAGFRGPVRAFVGGREQHVPAAAIPLTRHAEIVIEVGGYVVPHARYEFPPAF